MRHRSVLILLTAILFVGVSGTSASQALAWQQSRIAARVNGDVITVYRVKQELKKLGIEGRANDKAFNAMRERLIERSVIRQFLDSRNIKAPEAALDRAISHVDKILAQEEDSEAALKKLKMTRDELVRELSLPLAWQRYVRQVVTDRQLREYFEAHQNQLDGSKRTVRQVFLDLPDAAAESDVQSKINDLKAIRDQIQSGKKTFAEAARQYSESPTAEKGGLLGTFAFTGQMPEQIAEVSFETEDGTMSQPFVTQYGVHLLLVEKEIPGQLSLEDARPQIWQHFEDKLWQETIKRLTESGAYIVTRSTL